MISISYEQLVLLDIMISIDFSSSWFFYPDCACFVVRRTDQRRQTRDFCICSFTIKTKGISLTNGPKLPKFVPMEHKTSTALIYLFPWQKNVTSKNLKNINKVCKEFVFNNYPVHTTEVPLDEAMKLSDLRTLQDAVCIPFFLIYEQHI